MYFTDAGIEELDERRGDEQVTMAWLAERLRDFEIGRASCRERV